jgi:hypothetical protein
LFAHVVGGDEVQVGLRDFDEVAEHGIVAHLQALDARAFLLRAFEVGEPGLVSARQRPEPVQFRVVAGADVVSLQQIGGQLIGQSRLQQGAKRRKFGDS